MTWFSWWRRKQDAEVPESPESPESPELPESPPPAVDGDGEPTMVEGERATSVVRRRPSSVDRSRIVTASRLRDSENGGLVVRSMKRA